MERAKTQSHLERLDRLASMLKSEDFLTTKDLSDALNVSTRTLFRDLNILKARVLTKAEAAVCGFIDNGGSEKSISPQVRQ